MIKLGGLIDLKPLQEEKAFTATSKETGNVSVFKTKSARDAAIKAGTHEKRKTDKDTAVDIPGGEDKPKVNIFKKDKSDTPNSKTSDFSQKEKKELEALLDTSDDGNKNFSKQTIDDIIKTHKDKLSPKQIKDLKQAGEDAGKNLSKLIGDDFYPFEKYEKVKNEVGNRVKKILGLDGDKKEEPKSDTPKTLPYSDDGYDEIEQISSFDELQDYAQSKEGLSDEQRKQLQDLADEWEDAEGEMMAGEDDDEYEEATSAITAKAMEVVFGPEDSWGEPTENTSTRLRDLLPEEETFTAVNKKSGKTSVFKSKASRDAAIKKGTHSKTKEKGDSKKDGKGGVNIFNKDAGTQKSLFPDIKPDEKPTDDSDKIKDPKGMSKVVPKEIGTDVDKMEDWLFNQGGSIGDGQSFGLSDENENELSNLYYKYEDAVESGDKKEIERTKKDYFEFIYANLEKNQNKPKGPEANDYWNSDNKPAPKVGKFKAKPTEDAVKGLDLLSDMSIGGVPKLTPEDMGDKEYERQMLRMLFNSLEDANFHTHNRFIFADLEGKPEKRNTPDYANAPDLVSPEFDKWEEENTIFTKDFSSQFNRENERDDVLRRGAIDISKNSEWGGNEILAAYLQKLRKDGKDDLAARIQKSFEDAEKSMNEGRLTLGKLLPEPTINEGTRSQVGIIDRSGKIASAYVHYDGYPSNMKPGLKKHMKNEKDVLNLIKKGGARGIYNDKDIEYYKSGKPTKGNLKDFEKYVDAADRNGMAEYVYLYNMKDKKWYFADVYGDKKLKKLF